MKVVLANGKTRKVHLAPEAWWWRAWVWIRPFKREEQIAAGPHVVGNLIERLEREGIAKVVNE